MDEVVLVKVFDKTNGDLLFEGKVSTDVSPRDLSKLSCFHQPGYDSILYEDTLEQVESFGGLNKAKLVADGCGKYRVFSGVLYVGADDGVLRKSKCVPTWDCVMISAWLLSHEECEKLFQCETLVALEVNNCELRQIPKEAIGKLKRLEKLSMSHMNELKSVCHDVSPLSNLKHLWLERCAIENLPDGFEGLKCLERLTLKHLPDLKSVPDDAFGNLEHLKELCICNCDIDHLPKSMGALKRLEKLTLDELTKCQCMPEEMGDMNHLKHLEISYSGFERLPRRLPKSLSWLCLDGLPDLKVQREDLVVFSHLRHLKIIGCDSYGIVPSHEDAFYEMIKATTTLCFLEMDWNSSDEMMIERALQENGSIVEGECTTVSRNKANHERALACVLRLMSIRRWRNALNWFPKEMVKMLAMMLWNTRCDVGAWAEK